MPRATVWLCTVPPPNGSLPESAPRTVTEQVLAVFACPGMQMPECCCTRTPLDGAPTPKIGHSVVETFPILEPQCKSKNRSFWSLFDRGSDHGPWGPGQGQFKIGPKMYVFAIPRVESTSSGGLHTGRVRPGLQWGLSSPRYRQILQGVRGPNLVGLMLLHRGTRHPSLGAVQDVVLRPLARSWRPFACYQ